MNGTRMKFSLTSGMSGVLPLLLLCVSAGKAGAQSATPKSDVPSVSYKIAGVVVNSVTGAPLAEARISLVDTKTRKSVAQQKTAGGGRFEFAGLPAGKYSLDGSKRGYISASYEQHEQFSTAIVTGPELKTDELVLRLNPVALIGGHVRDEVGEPVRHAQVALFLDNHRGGMNRVTRLVVSSTDDAGYFDFSSLVPGTYFISVNAKPWYAVNTASTQTVGDSGRSGVLPALDAAYPTTYYSSATEAADATPIVVKAGDHPEIEVRLSPVPALHIIFKTGDDGQNGFPQPHLQRHVFDWVEPVQTGAIVSVEPGVYELVGVPPGKYTVRVNPGAQGEMEQANEMNLARDGEVLDTSRGEALSNLKITFKTEGGEAPQDRMTILLQDGRRRTVAGTQQNPSGEAQFSGLAAGKYSILCGAQGIAYAVTRTETATMKTSGHDVTIAAGVQQELTAWLTTGAVKLEGVVHKAGKPASGAMVLLIPKDPETHREYFRQDQSDFDGTFEVALIQPGAYTIVAVEDAWGVEWLQPRVLARYAQHGQELTIGPLMRGTVHLPDPVEVQPK
ncbi:MAG TPA: carboxypeptidase-like regulatory domain-containing protein [Candidatus Udaeobacter sp.]|nr:carboxypeptidase-like regulatory domain-containing protein [Candidatus Udaeobacter sp.]